MNSKVLIAVLLLWVVPHAVSSVTDGYKETSKLQPITSKTEPLYPAVAQSDGRPRLSDVVEPPKDFQNEPKVKKRLKVNVYTNPNMNSGGLSFHFHRE